MGKKKQVKDTSAEDKKKQEEEDAILEQPKGESP
jgi:hypothetical protein